MHEPPTTSHRAALQFSVPARCPSAAPGQAPLLAGSPPLSLEVNPLVTANLPMWATPRLLKERVLSHRQGLNLGWLSSVAMAKFGLHPESEAACTHWTEFQVTFHFCLTGSSTPGRTCLDLSVSFVHSRWN